MKLIGLVLLLICYSQLDAQEHDQFIDASIVRANKVKSHFEMSGDSISTFTTSKKHYNVQGGLKYFTYPCYGRLMNEDTIDMCGLIEYKYNDKNQLIEILKSSKHNLGARLQHSKEMFSYNSMNRVETYRYYNLLEDSDPRIVNYIYKDSLLITETICTPKAQINNEDKITYYIDSISYNYLDQNTVCQEKKYQNGILMEYSKIELPKKLDTCHFTTFDSNEKTISSGYNVYDEQLRRICLYYENNKSKIMVEFYFQENGLPSEHKRTNSNGSIERTFFVYDYFSE